jgi:hypothetical protein
MEKTYYVATLLFTSFISLAIASFTIICFKIDRPWFGFIFFVILMASILMNVLFARKWFDRNKNA